MPVLKSDTYFNKPEDLRSKSGSKIGCGISKALSAQKTTVKSRLPIGVQKSVVASATKPAVSYTLRPALSSAAKSNNLSS